MFTPPSTSITSFTSITSTSSSTSSITTGHWSRSAPPHRWLPPALTCRCRPFPAWSCRGDVEKSRSFLLHLLLLSPSLFLLFLSPSLPGSDTSIMGFVGLGGPLLLLLAVAGVCSAGSDAPRGVALGFVFDPKAKCEPPCAHAGVCIRNNTCFCSRGYEGETCKFGEDLLLIHRFIIWFKA